MPERAFELNSVDYLLKPVDREKLAAAVKKYHSLRGFRNPLDIGLIIEALDRGKRRYKERFAINVGSGIRSIETGSIAYFYTLDKNSFIRTVKGRNYPVDQALDRLEELMDPDRFFRINRQYLISYANIEKVSVLSRSRVAVHIKPPTEEPLLVSTALTHAFRQWLDR